MLRTRTNAHDVVFYYYVCIAGSIFTLVTASITVGHIIYHYVNIFHKSGNMTNKRRTPYVLFILLSFTALYISCVFAFVRANIFNSYSAEQYSYSLCMFGIYSVWFLFIIYFPALYSLFIYRIQLGFAETIYEYPKRMVKLFYATVFTSFILVSASFVYSASGDHYVVEQFEGTTQLFCSRDEDKDSHTKSVIVDAFSIAFIVLLIIFNSLTLYLFTKRLHALMMSLQRVLNNSKASCHWVGLSMVPRKDVRMLNAL
eukprot:648556_1